MCDGNSGWNSQVNKSLELRGLGAGPVIDCGGNGSAIKIDQVDVVVVDNLRIRRANGSEAGAEMQ